SARRHHFRSCSKSAFAICHYLYEIPLLLPAPPLGHSGYPFFFLAEAIAGIASLIAVVIVTTMVLWMKKASASMSGQLRGEMSQALETGGLAVALLAFLAVGREGVETALFMVGYAEAETLWPLTGLIVGVLIAAAIAYCMYAGAVRINLAKFFSYTGVFLVVVAAG
ncbi:FTR1 family protein, partial [Leuconostoc mesenteroides]|nr:FTR1 family protein [Leuconostoc mesenteroides]